MPMRIGKDFRIQAKDRTSPDRASGRRPRSIQDQQKGPFPLGRKGLRHPNMGQPNLYRQPQEVRDYGLHRMSKHDNGKWFDRTDGTIRQVCVCKLLVVPKPHLED